jgi:hypothetical protein
VAKASGWSRTSRKSSTASLKSRATRSTRSSSQGPQHPCAVEYRLQTCHLQDSLSALLVSRWRITSGPRDTKQELSWNVRFRPRLCKNSNQAVVGLSAQDGIGLGRSSRLAWPLWAQSDFWPKKHLIWPSSCSKNWPLGHHCLHHGRRAEERYQALEVVGEYMQTHLGLHPLQPLSQEVSRSHPCLDGSKWMFDS